MEQRIVCAAIRNHIGDIICGPRHFDKTMNQQIQCNCNRDSWKKADQGFVDQFGVFLTREEAWKIALTNGQIISRVGGDKGKLFSENLY